MVTRRAGVAGMFYPGEHRSLESLLGDFFRNAEVECPDSYGIVSPHAGYPYSGQLSASAFSTIPKSFKGTFILIGPSHSGFPTCISAIPWETPLGNVDVDLDLIGNLDLNIDEFSMAYQENSLEVQIPFIKYHFPDAKIVPVLMGDQSYKEAISLADSILKAINITGSDVRIVASSDFSHYIPEDIAKRQDLYAIDALKNLNIEEFYRRIKEEGVSACGYGPISVMVSVCRRLGATHGHLIKYTTSGETTGDYSQVVGYAAIAVV
ncbi:MAG: AmmeMemoRadiSam system protein B [Euryarchaeota archaeon]|nr:AmmeMemoRadiSam system protein B [Euryarchaeota archaeon]